MQIILEPIPSIANFLHDAAEELETCRKKDGSLNEEVVKFMLASYMQLRAMDKRHIAMIENRHFEGL